MIIFNLCTMNVLWTNPISVQFYMISNDDTIRIFQDPAL